MEFSDWHQKRLWERISQVALTCMNCLFFFLFFSLSLSAIFWNNGSYSYNIFKQIATGTGIALIISILFVLVSYFQIRRPSIWDHFLDNEKTILPVLFLSIFAIQLIIIRSIYTSVGWDVGIVMDAATSEITYNQSGYFSRYPNNFLLFMLYRLINNTLGNHLNIWLAADLVNIFFVDAALLLSFFCARKFFSRKSAYMVLILSLLLFGFSPWLIIPYSDTLAMPFPIGILTCYLSFLNTPKRYKKILLALLAGLLTFVGYLIKPTVIVVFLAIAIIGFLVRRKDILLHMLFLILAGAVIFAGNIGWNIFLQEQPWMPLDPEMKTPPEHFFMMGLSVNTYGGERSYYGTYCYEDVLFTFSFETLEERKAADLDEAFERIREFGPAGYARFLFNKARMITSEGVFWWGQEGQFAYFEREEKNFLQELFYINGKYFPFYLYFAQGVWLLVLCLTVVPFFGKWRKSFDAEHSIFVPLLRCSLLGILFFILLFEGRSRYLILYLPFFALLAGQALSYLFESVQKLFKNIFCNSHQ